MLYIIINMDKGPFKNRITPREGGGRQPWVWEIREKGKGEVPSDVISR